MRAVFQDVDNLLEKMEADGEEVCTHLTKEHAMNAVAMMADVCVRIRSVRIALSQPQPQEQSQIVRPRFQQ